MKGSISVDAVRLDPDELESRIPVSNYRTVVPADLTGASRSWAPGLDEIFERWAYGRQYSAYGYYLADWQEFLADLRRLRSAAAAFGTAPPTPGVV